MNISNSTTIVVSNQYLPNKYTKWYYDIVIRAKSRGAIDQLTETHHIIMDSFYKNRSRKGKPGWIDGDPNSPDNLVNLTLREHYICHLLLIRMTSGKAKVKAIYAARFFCVTKKDKMQVNARLYEEIKKQYTNIDKTGHTAWNKGIKLPEAQCIKMSESAKKRYIDPEQRKRQAYMKGKKHTEQTKALMSEQRQGYLVSDECKRKIGDANRGRKLPPVSDDTRAKLSKAGKNRVVTLETKKKISEATKGKKVGLRWWTNGISSVCVSNSPGVEWRLGRHKSSKKS